MTIGSKVIIKSEFAFIEKLKGVTGTITREQIPRSQSAMLNGYRRWVVEFDKPVIVCNEIITVCEFREEELAMAN
jgi:hypothetical protein